MLNCSEKSGLQPPLKALNGVFLSVTSCKGGLIQPIVPFKSFLFGIMAYIILFIKSRVKCVEVFAIKSVCSKAQCFAETLIMHNLALAQEFQRIGYIRVVYKP